ANLQHPHILPLFDSGAVDGTVFYVMPFVEGETLRDRLAREKQLPVADALRLATEVAGALDYAHRHGVIHRDIKPENILLHDGSALVADFGIALAASRADGGGRMTETGMSLGTPHYMSPEQAMGERSLDARTDVYALGAVVYEMLTGDPPFTGSSAQAIVAKVMTEKPAPIRRFRDTVPEPVEAAVLVALAKLPADRFDSAAEFARALVDGPTGRLATAPARAGRPGLRGWLTDPRTVALLTLSIATAAALAVIGPSRGTADARSIAARAIFPLDEVVDMRGADVAVSADGRVIATRGGSGLSIRRVDALEPRLLPGTEGGDRVFLSADGGLIGFQLADQLVIQSVERGDRRTQSGASFGGGTFLDDDRLVVADSTGLSLLTLSTGRSVSLVPSSHGARFQSPHALPGGKRVVFTIAPDGLAGGTSVLAVTVADRRVDTLVDDGSSGQYADGWLFFARQNGELHAVRFDPEAARPEGAVVPLNADAAVDRYTETVLAVGHGVVVYGQRQRNRLVLFGPDGRRTELLKEPGLYHSPRVSPDGRRVVFDRDDGPAGRDVWVLDLATNGVSRVTSIGDAHDPVWTPDGRRITFISFGHRPSEGLIFTVSADGAPGEEVLVGPAGATAANPGAWLPDGSGYAAGVVRPRGASDLVILRPGAAADTIVSTAFDEHSPAISPDGRWAAYTSNESGVMQVYVRRLSDQRGTRAVVSERGGVEPAWSRDGRELFYVEQGVPGASRLLSARIGPGDPPRVEARRVVVDVFPSEPVGNHTNWDVTPDGRFILAEPEQRGRLGLIFNWAPPEAARP
ncbi:MAG: protein kinase, partial [Gemmatimonadales bacterium]